MPRDRHGVEVRGSDLCSADLLAVDRAGSPADASYSTDDLPGLVARMEKEQQTRWIFEDTTRVYPLLLDAGVRIRRCHDLALVEAIVSMRSGRVPAVRTPVDARPGLFDAAPASDLSTLLERHRRHVGEMNADGGLRLLAAAESAGALAAAEMSHTGLPFSADAHRRHLEETLGPRPVEGTLPAALIALETDICDAFGAPVNPASHTEVLAAFGRLGIDIDSTKASVLRGVDHCAAELLLRHRDLAKLHSTNGWAWLDAWVRSDRFRPVYVPGGVVSGRWSSRGGGGLQIPTALRTSVRAEAGRTFVIADAGQLEPRILAAMSDDRRMIAAAGTSDLYAPVAAESFAGDRSMAKVAILGVLYGASAGAARDLLARLRARFPQAVQFVEDAARAGERGDVVHSWLGRACPPPPLRWNTDPDGPSDTERHSRGRFTRNFVVQATAAEWALCLLADLRASLAGTDSELVFFQHDEVVVHCPVADAESVRDHIASAAETASRLMFGDTAVRFPMKTAIRITYGEDRGDVESL